MSKRHRRGSAPTAKICVLKIIIIIISSITSIMGALHTTFFFFFLGGRGGGGAGNATIMHMGINFQVISITKIIITYLIVIK